ncbi:organic cation transporter protein-like [Amphiura filiformis]|uniref:organic cation transporter protein-like n=1 Tax=Amphiura filiformis TaxID=82378 RepID=UPI003B226ACB
MDLGKDLDNALRYLGVRGRYNWIVLSHLLIFTSGFPAAMTMILVFITSDPESYYCTPPDGFSRNDTIPTSDANNTNDFGKGCHMYEVHDGILTQNVTNCKNGYEYVYTYGQTSIVSEFDLVCDQRLLKDTATTVLMTGLLIGAYPMGHLCDRFGRKLMAFLSILLYGASGIGLAFAHNYYMFVVMWFLMGVFRQGTMIAGFVLLIEMLPPERRALGGLAGNMAWGFAVVTLALLAFLIRNWRHLQLVLSLGILVALPFWRIVNESVRWLQSQRRYDDAERILQQIAKFNRVAAPSKFLQASEKEALVQQTSTQAPVQQTNIIGATGTDKALGTNEDLGHKPTVEYSKLNEDNNGPKRTRLTVLDLFKTPNLAKNTLILTLDWLAASITYYGLSLNATNLAGNMYLNFFLLSLVEIPAYIMAYFTMEYFGGRKLTTALSLLVAGIACFFTAWIPETTANGTDLTTAIAAFAMIGKFAISYTWGGIGVYTPEVFPTGVRSAANGLLQSLSRIGAMAAPFIVHLNDVSPYLPLNIFGIFAMVAGALTFLLPETRNAPLPETLEDGEMMGKIPAPSRDQEASDKI